ncbi:MAG TPA: hypothetical protein VFP05_04550 [Thermomicrobiales bacterium]|nr:hypothetical protein [Thermomicrobiales bacterium]
MVEDSGTALRPHQLRPLNLPRAVSVETARGRPAAVPIPMALIDKHGERIAIAAIEEEWSIDDEWWRDRVQRHYFRVRLEHGPLRTIFLDDESGRWFEQSY